MKKLLLEKQSQDWITSLIKSGLSLTLLLFIHLAYAQPPSSDPCGRNTLEFDGADDYIDVNIPNFSYNSGTIEAWVRKDNWNDPFDDALFTNGIGNAESGSFYFSFHPAVGLHFRYGGSPDAGNTAAFVSKATTTDPLAANSWHHFAATWQAFSPDETELIIYIDGTLVTVQYAAFQIDSPITGDPKIFGIGKGSGVSHYVLQGGSIADVKVWNVARSGSEIQMDQFNEPADGESNLIAYWPLNEVSGTTACTNVISGGSNADLTNFDATTSWVDYPLVIKQSGSVQANGISYEFGQAEVSESTTVDFSIEYEGVPSAVNMTGRTPSITGTGADQFTLNFSGFPTDGGTMDIVGTGQPANFSITFQPAAASQYDAILTVPGASGCSDYIINLTGQGTAGLSYTGGFTETIDNDGSVFGGSILVTITGDTFQDDDANDRLEIGSQVSLGNIPDGLAPIMFLQAGNDNVAILNLTGNADFHEDAHDVADITFNFDQSAFTNMSIATPASSGLGIDFNDAPSLGYFPETAFIEPDINDGSIAGSMLIILTGDSFQNSGNDILTEGTQFAINNLPSGLTPVMDILSPTQVRLTFNGNADPHTFDENVSQINFSFTDAAFNTFEASKIVNAVNASASASITFIENGNLTWVGGTINFENDWHTASNWSPAMVPDETFNVNIEDPLTGSSFSVTISETATAASVNMQEGIGGALSLTITNESILIADNIINRGADILVHSGSAMAVSGSYDSFSGGTFTINRQVSGNQGYSVIGSPVDDVEFDDLGANLIYTYSEGSFVLLTEEEDEDLLDQGAGYFVSMNDQNPTISFSGDPNTGNMQASSPTTNQFYLVSNPYTAAISRETFSNTNSNVLDASIYLWDDGGFNNGSVRGGGYVTVNSMIIVGDAGLKGSAAFNGNIGVGQGFFVHTKLTGGATVFSPSMQVTTAGVNGDDAFYRKGDAENQILKLAIKNEALYDELAIGFTPAATEELDFDMDAHKFMNPGTSFYSLDKDGSKLAIQALPLSTGEVKAIDLGLYLPQAEMLTFEITKLEGFSEDVLIVLHDKETGMMYDLSSEPTVQLNSPTSSSDSRFELIFEPKNVLGINSDMTGVQVYADRSEMRLFGDFDQSTQIEVFTLDGREVLKQQVNFHNGSARFTHDLPAHQLYLLRVNNDAIKFIINTK